MKTFSTVARFQYSTEAQIVKGRLEAEGIPVFLADQFTIETDPLVSNAIGGIKLKVYSHDTVKALRVLENINEYSMDDAGENILCPNCGKDKVQFFTPIHSFRSLFSFLFSFFTNPKAGKEKYDYKCKECGFKFNMK